jgi:hypothetical protein
MIPKLILATFRGLPSMNIFGRAQSLILVKENQVDRTQNSLLMRTIYHFFLFLIKFQDKIIHK